ncbi:hypothetical protein STEG23_031613, partial [Scotinomys teguina]
SCCGALDGLLLLVTLWVYTIRPRCAIPLKSSLYQRSNGGGATLPPFRNGETEQKLLLSQSEKQLKQGCGSSQLPLTQQLVSAVGGWSGEDSGNVGSLELLLIFNVLQSGPVVCSVQAVLRAMGGSSVAVSHFLGSVFIGSRKPSSGHPKNVLIQKH